MTKEQFEREKKYQAALAVARSMLRQGVINDADLVRIEARLKEKFKPVLGGFFFEKPFFFGWLPITSVS